MLCKYGVRFVPFDYKWCCYENYVWRANQFMLYLICVYQYIGRLTYDCLKILNCTTYSNFAIVFYRPELLFEEAGIPGENQIFDRLQEQTKHTWKWAAIEHMQIYIHVSLLYRIPNILWKSVSDLRNVGGFLQFPPVSLHQ